MFKKQVRNLAEFDITDLVIIKKNVRPLHVKHNNTMVECLVKGCRGLLRIEGYALVTCLHIYMQNAYFSLSSTSLV